MAWDLGLAQGTSRGLQREQAWKTSDRNRSAAREDVQFEQLVNQINLNTERNYRRERDKVADTQWQTRQDFLEKQANIRNEQWGQEFDFRKQAEKTRTNQWNKEYDLRKRGADEATERHDYWKERQPKLDAMADKEHGLRVKGLEAEYDHLYGGETWFGKLIPDNLEKHFPQSMVRKKGYREMLREQSQQKIDDFNANAPLRDAQNKAALAEAEWKQKDYAYRNSPEGQAELKEIRQLDRDLKTSQIDYNKARAHSLRNPQSTSTSRVKPMTREDARKLGASITLPTIVTGNKPGWGHYLPYKDAPDKSSIHKIIMDQGYNVGTQLRSQNPASTTSVELDQIIGGVWEGMVGQVIGEDKRTFDTAILHGVSQDQMTSRRSEAYNTFRQSVLRGYNTPNIANDTAKQNVADRIFGAEGNTGDIDTSFWGASRPRGTGDNSINAAYDRVQARRIGENVRTDMGAAEKDFLFNMDAYTQIQADTYMTRGSLDWDNFAIMSTSQKSKLFNMLSPEKQAQFKIEWESFQQDQNHPLKARIPLR